MLGNQFVFGDVDNELGLENFLKVFGAMLDITFGCRWGQTLTVNNDGTGTTLIIHSLKEPEE